MLHTNWGVVVSVKRLLSLEVLRCLTNASRMVETKLSTFPTLQFNSTIVLGKKDIATLPDCVLNSFEISMKSVRCNKSAWYY